MKPIHFGSIHGNVSTLKVLINLGADPRSPRENDVRSFALNACYVQCIIIHINLLLHSLEDNLFIMHVLKVTCH